MRLHEFLFSYVIITLDDGRTVIGKVIGYDPDFDTDSGEDEIEVELPGITDAYLGLKQSDIRTIVKSSGIGAPMYPKMPQQFIDEEMRLFNEFMSLPDEEANWEEFYSKKASQELKDYSKQRREKITKYEDENGVII